MTGKKMIESPANCENRDENMANGKGDNGSTK